LANIKADLRTRIGEFDKRHEIETSVACGIVETESYAEELERELSRTMASQQFEKSDMTSEDDEQCSQITECRILRTEEALRLMRDGRYTEEMEEINEGVEPEVELVQEEEVVQE
jgi:hypothetical protein